MTSNDNGIYIVQGDEHLGREMEISSARLMEHNSKPPLLDTRFPRIFFFFFKENQQSN